MNVSIYSVRMEPKSQWEEEKKCQMEAQDIFIVVSAWFGRAGNKETSPGYGSTANILKRIVEKQTEM